ncbi:protein of unknown function DUF1471 (plasmid) [Enterobacter soli]|uniref:DUF1471 domain-containing protein n=1 Tax=Enterobacter soli TaxID=885040 RepID=UPI000223CEC3|nr:DUF1471 domain-containing protein [Enterobacter soli]AEN67187.1 protein of unknown function DUF1471 [Enterobacter soli]OAT35104.1 hypothetical protein M987_04557 [Enterobacter soli ATCC BAA-2102]
MRITALHAICASALLLLSHASFGASEVQNANGHHIVGQISLFGASTVDDAVRALAYKADAAGAPYFKTVAVGGKNKLFASAELLK